MDQKLIDQDFDCDVDLEQELDIEIPRKTWDDSIEDQD